MKEIVVQDGAFSVAVATRPCRLSPSMIHFGPADCVIFFFALSFVGTKIEAQFRDLGSGGKDLVQRNFP